MANEQVKRIKEYVRTFNKLIDTEHEDLLTYAVEVVIDRVLFYLNHEVLEEKFERITADIVYGVFTKYKVNETKNPTTDTMVSSVSDNGQSISYSNEVRNYLNTASDNELLSGFTNLLSRYRRIKVVTPSRV